MASAPAHSASRASARVVAQANHAIPCSFNLATNCEEYRPMIEETTVGLTAIKESHCFSKSGNRIPFGSAGTAGAQLDRDSRTRCSAAKLRAGAAGSAIPRFNLNGPRLRERNSAAQLAIDSRVGL